MKKMTPKEAVKVVYDKAGGVELVLTTIKI